MCKVQKITATLTIAPTEVLVLDTNILLWTFYSKLTPKKVYQTKDYPAFVSTAIAQKNPIIVTTFCLNEMLHIIEKTEYDIYKSSKKTSISLKNYRKIPAERAKVKTEIDLIHNQLQAIPTLQIIKSKATRKTINRFAYYYDTHLADFFDFCLISFCNNHHYAVVSDDQDFNTPFCKGTLYSANPVV